jgi:hypothetical protein
MKKKYDNKAAKKSINLVVVHYRISHTQAYCGNCGSKWVFEYRRKNEMNFSKE